MNASMKVVCAVTLFVASGFSHCRGQNAERSIAKLSLPPMTMTEVIRTVGVQTSTVVGAEIAGAVYPGTAVTLNFPGGTLTDLFDSVTSLQAGWTWRRDVSGGVVFQKSGEMRGLAEVVIDFPGVTNATRKDLWVRLDRETALEEWMSSNKCGRLEIDSGGRWKAPSLPITLSAGRFTLEGYLSTISRLSGSNFWYIVQIYDGRSCYVSIQL